MVPGTFIHPTMSGFIFFNFSQSMPGFPSPVSSAFTSDRRSSNFFWFFHNGYYSLNAAPIKIIDRLINTAMTSRLKNSLIFPILYFLLIIFCAGFQYISQIMNITPHIDFSLWPRIYKIPLSELLTWSFCVVYTGFAEKFSA